MKSITIKNIDNIIVSDLLEGIKILLKYDSTSDIAASHDIIYFCGVEEVSKEDKEVLDDLGWRFDSSVDSWIKGV